MKKAACAFIIKKEDPSQVLMVSRKYDHTSFGLIGGKLDEGESALECCVRELLEESGLKLIQGITLSVLYAGICVDELKPENVYDCTTFLIYFEDLVQIQEPEEGGGIVKWIKVADLANENFKRSLFNIRLNLNISK